MSKTKLGFEHIPPQHSFVVDWHLQQHPLGWMPALAQKIDVACFEEYLTPPFYPGWSHDEFVKVAGEYRRFLFLAACSHEWIVPTRSVSALWHHHILAMEKYRYDCESAFGTVILHNSFLV